MAVERLDRRTHILAYNPEDKTLLKHHRGSYSPPPSKHCNKKTPTISVGVFVVSNARSNRYEQKVTR